MDWKSITVLLGIIVTWSGVFLWAVKGMLAQNQNHADERFEVLGKALTAQEDKWQATDRALLHFKAELPREYVRREDWIRFGATIDTKLDRLHDKLDNIKGRENYEGHRSRKSHS